MNLNRVQGQSQQSGTNTNTISVEGGQVNALLSIIEVQQAQSNGLRTEQQKTIEELIGRVKDLTDKQDFLENELLAEKKKSAELKKKQDDQEKARFQQEQARLEAARKENEEKRKQLEAEKTRKKEEITSKINRAREYSNAASLVLGHFQRTQDGGYTSTSWCNDIKYPFLDRFCDGPLPIAGTYGYRIYANDADGKAHLVQEVSKYESLLELLKQEEKALSK